MATLTTLTGLNQAETVHAGVNAVICKVSISATTSAGDVLRIGRLPHQAVVLYTQFHFGAAFVDNGIHKFGLSGTDACFLASDSYSVTVIPQWNNVNLINLNTSRSDDSGQRFTYITTTPTAVLSAGHYGTLVVYYKQPGQSV